MKRLFGSLVLAAMLASALTAANSAPSRAREQRVAIAVTSRGFEPAALHVKAGELVLLVVTRKTDRTCVRDIVLKDYGIKQPLALNKPVEIRFTPRKPGAIRYACGMDMVAGSLIVE